MLIYPSAGVQRTIDDLDLIDRAVVSRAPHPRFEGDVLGVRSTFTTEGHVMTMTPVNRACGSVGWSYACSCGYAHETATPCFDGCHRRIKFEGDLLHAGLSLKG